MCDKIRALYVSAYKAYDNASIRSTYLMFLINLFLTIDTLKGSEGEINNGLSF